VLEGANEEERKAVRVVLEGLGLGLMRRSEGGGRGVCMCVHVCLSLSLCIPFTICLYVFVCLPSPCALLGFAGPTRYI
jgi:hypothetical protein